MWVGIEPVGLVRLVSEGLVSANTSIQWTDRTWNPVRGCSRVSPGCDHCYAMGQAHRFAGPGKPYEGLTTIRRGKVDWTGTARLVPGELLAPLRWRKPQRVFVNSMSDLFHSSLSNEEIAAVFGVMAAAPQHTFQVLTKRPERAAEWFRWVDGRGDEQAGCLHVSLCGALQGEHDWDPDDRHCEELLSNANEWPLSNVWLGVSVENQQAADERPELLLKLPAALRFISAEPLLERVTLNPATLGCRGHLAETFGNPLINWVIAGGESGPGARPCALEWIESIVAQCREASVPVFVKQLGACVVSEQRACETDEIAKRDFGFSSRWLWRAGLTDKKGGDMAEWPDELQIREFPDA
jgi:protein gp37